MSIHRFFWPEPRRHERAVVPVFLPFAGCRTRCVYCAQPEQTGAGPLPGQNPAPALARALAMLEARRERGLPAPELAFYGGTFTAQRPRFLEACLDAAARWMERGLIAAWRCSTRPDALDDALLARMKALGCATVELGVQSLDDRVLAASRRGYGGALAGEAMTAVRSAGLVCGAQLLPGLPGSTAETFAGDVAGVLALGAGLLRFYPCLVLRGTALARMYARGEYTPWDTETTVDALARGWAMAMAAGVPVIRMGVAAEPSLLASLLAGPWDPALGTRVKSRALLRAIRGHLPAGAAVSAATLPRSVQGYLYGQGGETAPLLAAMGVTPASVTWSGDGEIVLRTAD